MDDPITCETVKAWLKQHNHDRQWLAEALGFSKRTVDNWFTEGTLPEPAIKHFRRIKAESEQPKNLRFTLDQWDEIEDARRLAGFTDRAEFITQALTAYAKSVTADNIVPLSDHKRVAEDTDPSDEPSGLSDGD